MDCVICWLQPMKEFFCSLISSSSNASIIKVESVTHQDICVFVVPVNWGKGDKNPVDSVYFYSKDSVFSNHSSNYCDVSAMLPKSFQEIQVHVLCRRSDSYAFQVARCCFDNYWNCAPIKTLTNGTNKSNSHL
ncbi:deoxynucleoside triphosphate triphosphohydrolase SAMHD1 [Caerostris extrusa]|uniref:Deoxynucleoside triphosphate triphosphohydrolase SAMHD1 n=1 Tax=Caerostris extrusa TaxID=172846 RepID=A0AAV4YDR0_CAEEX|nr:deoxynucleoside triphosphate triphosphohydrolase SAMHD1 [Caerostris extrusa]